MVGPPSEELPCSQTMQSMGRFVYEQVVVMSLQRWSPGLDPFNKISPGVSSRGGDDRSIACIEFKSKYYVETPKFQPCPLDYSTDQEKKNVLYG